MSHSFHGWRRKIGVLTLMIALVFMAGWMRSIVSGDFIEFPLRNATTTPDISGLLLTNQSMYLFWHSELVMVPDVAAGTVPDQIQVATFSSAPLDEDGNIDLLGGQSAAIGTGAMTVSLEPKPFVVIPFLSIVVPLTLLSAYLVLSGPRLQRKQTATT